MDGSMTNSPLMSVFLVESMRELVGLVLKVEGGATLVPLDLVESERELVLQVEDEVTLVPPDLTRGGYDGGGWRNDAVNRPSSMME